jgi:hypothetical protein
VLGCNSRCRRELTAGDVRAFYSLEFSGRYSRIEIAANLSKGDLPHTSAKAITDQGALVHNGLSLEVLVARKCQRFPDSAHSACGFFLTLLTLTSGADNCIGLVAKVGGKLAMRGHYLAG